MQYHQFIGTERQHGISTTLVIAELYLKHAVSKQLNNGAHLASMYASVRYILKHCYNIKQVYVVFHKAPSFSNHITTDEPGEILAVPDDPNASHCGVAR